MTRIEFGTYEKGYCYNSGGPFCHLLPGHEGPHDLRDPVQRTIEASLGRNETRLIVRLLRERVTNWKLNRRPELGRHIQDEALADYLEGLLR
jgi:hypothetical protein